MSPHWRMQSLRLVALLLAGPAFAQSYGVGRATTPEELRRLDISRSILRFPSKTLTQRMPGNFAKFF